MNDSYAYPKPLTRLAGHLKRLPGIGQRTAERLSLAMLEWPPEALQAMAAELAGLIENVKTCAVCGNLADTDECGICRSQVRQRDTICVVESASQILVFEKSGSYHGLYHVLGGRLLPLEGKGPEDLRLQELHGRLKDGTVVELILATSPDVAGEATAHFLADEFSRYDLQITRIAAGVPVGADLSYADSATLAMAMGGRHRLKA